MASHWPQEYHDGKNIYIYIKKETKSADKLTDKN